MPRAKKELLKDLVIVGASIAFAIFIASAGAAHNLALSFGELKWLGIFIAGIFFTSVFTAAPAAVVLGQFAESTHFLPLALLGGLGAMVGDYIIFYFIKNRISDDISYLLSLSRHKRFPHIFRTRLFRLSLPFLGAVIIASPLPDEIGIAMLGFSKVGDRFFLAISFIMNGLGILAIGWIARMITG